jgi:hypothetical protein
MGGRAVSKLSAAYVRHVYGTLALTAALTAGYLVLVLTGTGCQKDVASPVQAEVLTADSLLRMTVSAYRAAAGYQDQAVVRLRYRRDGQPLEDEAPLSISWQRPNRIHLQAYQVRLASDGERLVARVQDEATRDLDGQVIDRPAPAKLTLAELFEKDEILGTALRQGVIGVPPQLDLLLGAQALAEFGSAQAERRLLDPVNVDGHRCDGLQVNTSERQFVLWIDQATRVVRRMEFPAATFLPEMLQDDTVSDIQLLVDFRGATFLREMPRSLFTMTVAKQAKRVQAFIAPPQELPSELFGQVVAPWSFVDLEGDAVSHDSLGDRIKVLLWFNNHPAGQLAMQQLHRVRRQYQAQSRVTFTTVCAEPSSVTSEGIRGFLKQWQVDLPVVRDSESLGRDLFRIPGTPALFVLNEKNAVQIVEVGANSDLAAELPQVLERLLAGEDLAAEILNQQRDARRSYESALASGRPFPATTNQSSLAAASQPELLQLKPLWTREDLVAAGNLIAVPTAAAGDSQFLMHEGFRSLVELDSDGKLLARHELELPESAAVSQLQTAAGRDGQRYYVTWSLRSPQVHVFDRNWKRVLSYPSPALQHEGVADALLADLDGDGVLELGVGFWGATGVHAVSLSGSCLWSNNELSHVSSLAVDAASSATPTVWAASASGQVVAIDRQGRVQAANPAGRHLHHLFGSPADASGTGLCAIAYETTGRRLALDLNSGASPRWKYELPAGSFQNPIRFATSAPLLDRDSRQWVFAGPDGSVHVVAGDGQLHDHFYTGLQLTGIAGGRRGAAGLLVVSSATGVKAWQVELPATAARTVKGPDLDLQ